MTLWKEVILVCAEWQIHATAGARVATRRRICLVEQTSGKVHLEFVFTLSLAVGLSDTGQI